MSVRRTRAALFLALATVSFAATAAAQDAAGLVRAGVTARREGRDADALALFERAAQSDARASTLAQVGFALQALGRWAEAEAQLERVSALDDPWVLRHRDVIDGALVTVRSHLATLELACSPAGAEVFVDGRSIGVAPLARPVRLAAGSVTVTARLEGYFLPNARSRSSRATARGSPSSCALARPSLWSLSFDRRSSRSRARRRLRAPLRARAPALHLHRDAGARVGSRRRWSSRAVS
jgi:hypothetical protein